MHLGIVHRRGLGSRGIISVAQKARAAAILASARLKPGIKPAAPGVKVDRAEFIRAQAAARADSIKQKNDALVAAMQARQLFINARGQFVQQRTAETPEQIAKRAVGWTTKRQGRELRWFPPPGWVYTSIGKGGVGKWGPPLPIQTAVPRGPMYPASPQIVTPTGPTGPTIEQAKTAAVMKFKMEQADIRRQAEELAARMVPPPQAAAPVFVSVPGGGGGMPTPVEQAAPAALPAPEKSVKDYIPLILAAGVAAFALKG